MQNKHHFFSVLGVSNFDKGGVGRPGWDKIPNFSKNSIWRLPLCLILSGALTRVACLCLLPPSQNLPTGQKAASGKGTSKCCLPFPILQAVSTVGTYTQLKLLQFYSILGSAVHFTAVTDCYLGLFGSSAEQQPGSETKFQGRTKMHHFSWNCITHNCVRSDLKKHYYNLGKASKIKKRFF